MATMIAIPLIAIVADPDTRALLSPEMFSPDALVLVGAAVDGALEVAGTPAVGSEGAAVVGFVVDGAAVVGA
jgi:hypothetical protein